ncbi:carbohydrate-binding protein [Nonomuraea sp. GTA35]|uniref:carbohydrate-binding protein n=1 Tax=Nonomuraea sp. GTA35 TaxID=1676746 RepID=UPI0035C163FA
MRLKAVTACAGLFAGVLVGLSPSAAHAAPTRYEAETSPAVCTGTIDSNHAGFSGSGFCNGTNTTGAHAQFTVNASAAGTATLAVRFASGTSSSRPADLTVNGTTVQSVSFEGTGAWSTWVTKTMTVSVNSGSNTIRFNPTSSAGLPNIDYIDVEAGGTTQPPGDTLYVAPNGTDSAAGTESNPTTLTSAITRIAAGGTIYMRGGRYDFSQTVTIAAGNDGTSGARKKLSAYPGETPVLNFSAQSEDPANRGLAVGGSFWHIYGIVVERAGDNGILLAGNNNIIERTVTRFNRDSGLQLSRLVAGAPREQWPSNNLILSAVSHDNADSDGEDADGFAPKLTVGPGNVFRYTVSHNNIDDGYDLFTKTDTGPIGAVTIEDSLAYDNGTLSNGGQAGNGDRNGYKLGGEDIGVNHVIQRNIAHGNGKHGFTYNRNLGTMTVSSNVSIGNEERNFNFDGGSSVFRNNTSCDSGSNDRIIGNADSSNQFWSGSNGSRCSSYSGALAWSFAADGRLVVTFGGTPVTP